MFMYITGCVENVRYVVRAVGMITEAHQGIASYRSNMRELQWSERENKCL